MGEAGDVPAPAATRLPLGYLAALALIVRRYALPPDPTRVTNPRHPPVTPTTQGSPMPSPRTPQEFEPEPAPVPSPGTIRRQPSARAHELSVRRRSVDRPDDDRRPRSAPPGRRTRSRARRRAAVAGLRLRRAGRARCRRVQRSRERPADSHLRHPGRVTFEVHDVE